MSKHGLVGKGKFMLLTLSAFVTLAVLFLMVEKSVQPAPSLALAAQSADKSADKSLAECPELRPVLRIAGHFNEEFTPHPAENRFASIHYTRLHQMTLFGADPREENIDKTYGVAEAWEFLPGAKGLVVTLREGLTFNNGDPITAEEIGVRAGLSSVQVLRRMHELTTAGLAVADGEGLTCTGRRARCFRVD